MDIQTQFAEAPADRKAAAASKAALNAAANGIAGACINRGYVCGAQ